MSAPKITIGLNAVIAAIDHGNPQLLLLEEEDTLPFGLFDPKEHLTLEKGLRMLVARQTGREMGYVEQLYTFGNLGRVAGAGAGEHIVSVSYLALTRGAHAGRGRWHSWYALLPWEDNRGSQSAVLEKIRQGLHQWAQSSRERQDRARLCFASEDNTGWDEEKAPERYELLYEAGLVQEAQRDGGQESAALGDMGSALLHDHRRIAATALGRLRGKLKYRPVIFEMMPPFFTLYELQQAAEAIAGTPLHKQNFRRLVEREELVERTGEMMSDTGGRPAAQFRFRREILRERPAPSGLLLTARPR